MKNEKVPEQKILSSFNHEMRAQPSAKSFGNKDVNEKTAKVIRNALILYFERDNF